jgi:hypothetical protein
MCTDQVLHCYASPHQALFLNSIHANIKNPRLFMIECSDLVATDGLKHACKSQTPIKEISLPILTTNQRVAIAIKLALTVSKAVGFVRWASNWLNGTNRTAASAAAYANASAAYASASSYAASAAYAAADANDANASSYAASAASAYAATAYASSYAAYARFFIDFEEIVEWTLKNIK